MSPVAPAPPVTILAVTRDPHDLHAERDLVDRARVDANAFATLYRQYLPKVHGYALRRTGSVQAAEDITAILREQHGITYNDEDDFTIFEEMKRNGVSPEDACIHASELTKDWPFWVRMLRSVYGLTLEESSRIMTDRLSDTLS